MASTPAPMLSSETQQLIPKLWGLQGSCTFQLIKHSENHTYMIEQTLSDETKQRFILRMTPQNHRSQDAIRAELDYILLLHQAGLPHLKVCRPIPLGSDSNELIATTTPYDKGDANEWYAVLFEYAKGKSVMGEWRCLWDEGVIAAWGRCLGQLHHAILLKGKDEDRWNRMTKHIPNCNQTHGGATDIQKLHSRAEAGHETSRALASLWDEKLAPFLATCGDPETSPLYSVIHGDLNPSNFFAEDIEHQSLPEVWVFDFDQSQHNWFGFDVGTILQMAQFFADYGWGGKPIEKFDGGRFKEVFLAAYKEACPRAMIEAGHLEQDKLSGWQLYREFFQAAVAVDVLWQVEKTGRQYEDMIVSYCRTLAGNFTKKYVSGK